MLSCANPMSLTSSGISDSSTPDAWRKGNNGTKTLIPPRRCDSMKEISILTNLNVTFLLFWGSSTIFCKLAATGRRQKKRDRRVRQLLCNFYISSNQTAAFCCNHVGHHARGVTWNLPMTRSLPSTRPAETNSWETPSAESEHSKRKSSGVRR